MKLPAKREMAWHKIVVWKRDGARRVKSDEFAILTYNAYLACQTVAERLLLRDEDWKGHNPRYVLRHEGTVEPEPSVSSET